jgi:hypothetical protein
VFLLNAADWTKAAPKAWLTDEDAVVPRTRR